MYYKLLNGTKIVYTTPDDKEVVVGPYDKKTGVDKPPEGWKLKTFVPGEELKVFLNSHLYNTDNDVSRALWLQEFPMIKPEHFPIGAETISKLVLENPDCFGYVPPPEPFKVPEIRVKFVLTHGTTNFSASLVLENFEIHEGEIYDNEGEMFEQREYLRQHLKTMVQSQVTRKMQERRIVVYDLAVPDGDVVISATHTIDFRDFGTSSVRVRSINVSIDYYALVDNVCDFYGADEMEW